MPTSSVLILQKCREILTRRNEVLEEHVYGDWQNRCPGVDGNRLQVCPVDRSAPEAFCAMLHEAPRDDRCRYIGADAGDILLAEFNLAKSDVQVSIADSSILDDE